MFSVTDTKIKRTLSSTTLHWIYISLNEHMQGNPFMNLDIPFQTYHQWAYKEAWVSCISTGNGVSWSSQYITFALWCHRYDHYITQNLIPGPSPSSANLLLITSLWHLGFYQKFYFAKELAPSIREKIKYKQNSQKQK